MADASRALDKIFDEKVLTPRLTAQVAPRTAPGLTNTKPEDPKAPAGEQLNWWQASNQKKLGEFLKALPKERQSEGILLCDAPGLGKTLSVLSTIVSTLEKPDDDCDQLRTPKQGLVIIFAGKGIINNVWVAQIHRHFDPAVSGTDIFCADSQNSKHELASPLSSRPNDAHGGVYVEERATAWLPPKEGLRSFSVLVFAKEMLAQKLEHERVRDPLTNQVGCHAAPTLALPPRLSGKAAAC